VAPSGELDKALAFGNRALEIATASGDLDLRIPATSYLAQLHYHRGEYEREVQLAYDNVARLRLRPTRHVAHVDRSRWRDGIDHAVGGRGSHPIVG
jgi:hypothetical protein